MANQDCTTPKIASNTDDSWFLSQGHYPVRRGNRFTPYFSGKEAFAALASSIESAKRSIDIITWGFDPAMPLRRDHPEYQQHYVVSKEGVLQPLTRKEATDKKFKNIQRYSGWRQEDAYGQLLLDALKNNDLLKVRLVIWHTQKNPVVPNLIGLDPWVSLSSIARDEISTGFDPLAFGGEQGIMDMLIGEKGLSDLTLRQRHPDAQQYSWHWFYRLLWLEERQHRDPSGKLAPRVLDRIAVVFRSIVRQPIEDEDDLAPSEKLIMKDGAVDHQKYVLIDIDATAADKARPHAYLFGHNALTESWSDLPFVHRDPRNEMDRRPFHDLALKVEGPLLIDLSDNFCEAWNNNRTRTLDHSMLRLQGLLSDNDPNAITLDSDGNPFKLPPTRKLLVEAKEELGQLRSARYAELEQRLALGDEGVSAQIVRTRTDQRHAKKQEKDIKDAYLAAFKQGVNYIFIVNHNCQYQRLLRHLKYWWQRRRDTGNAADRRRILHVLIGINKPENVCTVLRTQQFINELGCAGQFGLAAHQLYSDADHEMLLSKSNNNAVATAAGNGKNAPRINPTTVLFPRHTSELQDGEEPQMPWMPTTSYVSAAELKAMHIRPLVFMLYTKIPPATTNAARDQQVAQQVSVHGQLCVIDDKFFTVGSANMNTRSMAIDSELNVISDDQATAKCWREKLWRTYLGLNDPDLPAADRLRLERILATRSDTLSGGKMEAIYRAFKLVAAANAIRVRRGLPVQGSVVTFQDARGFADLNRLGI